MLQSCALLPAPGLPGLLFGCGERAGAFRGLRGSKSILPCRLVFPVLGFLAFLLAGPAVTVRGQVVNLAAQREHLSAIDSPWRFHTGDDARWAEPSLDDSAWKLMEPGRDWVRQGYRETNGLAWLRFRLLVPPQTPSLVIALPLIQKITSCLPMES